MIADRAGIPLAELNYWKVRGKVGSDICFELPESWAERRLRAAPAGWRERIGKIHATRVAADSAAGNAWLVAVTDRLKKLKVPIDLSDAEIIELAGKCASECMSLGGVGAMTLEALRGRLDRYCERYGIVPPMPLRKTRRGVTGTADGPAVSRMTCRLWWRRKLRVAQGRMLEASAIELGYVHRRGEVYCSDATVERRSQQKNRNAATLAATVAVCEETRQERTLAQLAEASVANPRIRRGELMTRIAGFEWVARIAGHVALFFTVTAPSRFHPKRTAANAAVLDNPKWVNGGELTPRDAQQYLTSMWAKVRAALARAGAAVYGFRIAEPHHDAAPHWHLLLFCAAEVKAAVCTIFAGYARAEDADEMQSPAARKARFDVVVIDPKKGTAAGYIAKYIGKNIDGYQVQGVMDHDAGDARKFELKAASVTASQRVEAWASRWGIRQFQQIGGPPVGVWRELRRLREPLAVGGVVEDLRRAADCGGGRRPEGKGAGEYWAEYVKLQGGPSVARRDLTLRAAYTLRWCDGRLMLNAYGEVAGKSVFGVVDQADVVVETRLHTWVVRSGGKFAVDADGVMQPERKICRSGMSVADVWVRVRAAGLASPWSPDNNCTPVIRSVYGPAWIDPAPAVEWFKTGAALLAWQEERDRDERKRKHGSGGAGAEAEIRHGESHPGGAVSAGGGGRVDG